MASDRHSILQDGDRVLRAVVSLSSLTRIDFACQCGCTDLALNKVAEARYRQTCADEHHRTLMRRL
jgi:hypothetical protein